MNRKDIIKNGQDSVTIKKHLCKQCSQKSCLTACPAANFTWDETGDTIVLNNEGCLECGTCSFICPLDAIEWSYPMRLSLPDHGPQGTVPVSHVKANSHLQTPQLTKWDSKRQHATAQLSETCRSENTKPENREMETLLAENDSNQSGLTHFNKFYIFISRIKNIYNIPREFVKRSISDGKINNLRWGFEGNSGLIKMAILILAFAFLLFPWIYLYWNFTNLTSSAFEKSEQGIYYASDSNWAGWEGSDYEISDGSVKLFQRVYYAPHLKYRLSTEESIWDEAVLKMTMRLERFTGSAYTLFSVHTSSGDISLVNDTAGRIGIIKEPNSAPEYSESVLDSGEYVIHLHLDKINKEISAYVDGNFVISEEWDNAMYTVRELFIGSFWVGGANNFGAPQGHVVNEVILGDSNLLLAGYSFRQFISEEFPWASWLLNPFIIAALLLLVYLTLLLIENKKRVSN